MSELERFLILVNILCLMFKTGHHRSVRRRIPLHPCCLSQSAFASKTDEWLASGQVRASEDSASFLRSPAPGLSGTYLRQLYALPLFVARLEAHWSRRELVSPKMRSARLPSDWRSLCLATDWAPSETAVFPALLSTCHHFQLQLELKPQGLKFLFLERPTNSTHPFATRPSACQLQSETWKCLSSDLLHRGLESLREANAPYQRVDS